MKITNTSRGFKQVNDSRNLGQWNHLARIMVAVFFFHFCKQYLQREDSHL